MKKHFVTFLSPGAFLAEENTIPIESWNVKKAQKMTAKIKQGYSAVPYGFYFTTRSRATSDLDSKETKRSGTYYLPHCKVETLAEVKARKNPEESILIANMEGNGWNKIVTTMSGWKWTQPFTKEDTLLT